MASLCTACNGKGGFEVPPKNPIEKPGWRECKVCNGTGVVK